MYLVGWFIDSMSELPGSDHVRVPCYKAVLMMVYVFE